MQYITSHLTGHRLISHSLLATSRVTGFILILHYNLPSHGSQVKLYGLLGTTRVPDFNQKSLFYLNVALYLTVYTDFLGIIMLEEIWISQDEINLTAKFS